MSTFTKRRLALGVSFALHAVVAGCAASDRAGMSSGGGAGGQAAAGQSNVSGGTGGTAGAQAGQGADAAAGAQAGAGAAAGAQAGAGAAAGGAVQSMPDAAAPESPFIIGADITWVQADESVGATYSDGTPRDILSILKDHGFNYIRLRTFVDPKAQDGYDPQNGFGDLAHTVAFAKRIKAAGLGLLLDLHYSDNWADPGKQCVPIAWQKFTTITQMADALRRYTTDTLTALIAADARPDMVQIGNEITPGMDIHVCDANGQPTGPNAVGGPIANWANLGALLHAGSAAVKTIDPSILVMLHLDRGNDYQTSHDFIVAARAAGVAFDVFGESCYTAYQGQPADWASTFSKLGSAFPDLKFAIAEYGSEARAANDLLFALPNAQGLGSFVWEPTRAGAWNTGHALFEPVDHGYIATADLLLYDEMKVAYAARLY